MTRTRIIAAAIAAPVTGVLLMTGTASAAPHATPESTACKAAATWEHSRTARNLYAMMTASMAAPWKYTGSDITSLYTDVRSGAVKYVAKDIAYISEDCKA